MILVLIAPFLFVGLAWVPSARAEALCETEVLDRFLGPLKNMPRLRSIPSSGELPIGPSDVSLGLVGQMPLRLPNNGPLGYTLFLRRSAPGGRTELRISWLVTTKLARMNADGTVREMLGSDQKRVISLRQHRNVPLRVDPPDLPGLYRLEIVFRKNGSNVRLGRFGSYFRVLRPTSSNSELTLNGMAFLPGETVSARAAEYGAGWLSLQDTFLIETYDGSTWSRAPIDPKHFSLLIGYLIGPGEATPEPCWRFTIPTEASPGLYRFVVRGESMTILDGRRLAPGSQLTLSSEFRIE